MSCSLVVTEVPEPGAISLPSMFGGWWIISAVSCCSVASLERRKAFGQSRTIQDLMLAGF